jgi:hypothetical protein
MLFADFIQPKVTLKPIQLTKSATKVAEMSLSNPIFINAFLGILSLIINVTSLPKFLKILANSIAIIPLP